MIVCKLFPVDCYVKLDGAKNWGWGCCCCVHTTPTLALVNTLTGSFPSLYSIHSNMGCYHLF